MNKKYFANLKIAKSKLKAERIDLGKLSTIRREMTNTVKKYNSTISEAATYAVKFSHFQADFSTIEGKMEKALKQAEDLGVDKEVQKLKSDISYLKILKGQAGEAMSLIDKVRKQKA